MCSDVDFSPFLPMISAVINALSQRYFLQANDQKDLKDWVEALNQASKITVRMVSSAFRSGPRLFPHAACLGGEGSQWRLGLSQNLSQTRFPYLFLHLG